MQKLIYPLICLWCLINFQEVIASKPDSPYTIGFCSLLKSQACEDAGDPHENTIRDGLEASMRYFFKAGNYTIIDIEPSQAFLRELKKDGPESAFETLPAIWDHNLPVPNLIVFGTVRCTSVPENYEAIMTIYCAEGSLNGPCEFHFKFTVENFHLTEIGSMKLVGSYSDRLIGFFPSFIAAIQELNANKTSLMNSIRDLEFIEYASESLIDKPLKYPLSNDCDEFEAYGQLEIQFDRARGIKVDLPEDIFKVYSEYAANQNSTWPIIQGRDPAPTVTGRIIVHNSRFKTGETKYLEGVEIVSPCSSPTYSDANGYFKLVVADRKFGEKVPLDIKSNGYEVVNKKELEYATVGMNSEINIYVAQKGEIEKMQQQYYEISVQAINKKYDELVYQYKLEDSIGNSVFLELYPSQVDFERFLGEKKKESINALYSFSSRLATINFDNVSDEYRSNIQALVEEKEYKKLVLLGMPSLLEIPKSDN